MTHAHPIRTFIRALQLVICLHVIAESGAAQPAQILCVEPTAGERGCLVSLARNPSEQRVIIKLVRFDSISAIRGIAVQFRASSGWIDSNVVTSMTGEAAAVWFGSTDSGAVRILATARVNGTELRRGIVIGPPIMIDPRREYLLSPVDGPLPDTLRGRHEYGYTKKQIASPAVVEIQGPKSKLACDSVLVLFRQTSSGAVTPDKGYGSWVKRPYQVNGGPSDMCIARARWTLGEQVGEHHLLASLSVDSTKSVEFTARARALPRLIAGLALSQVSGYYKLSESSQKITVTRQTPAGKISFDSTVSTTALTKIRPEWKFMPTLGVDWPLKTNWSNVRVSLSTSLTDARNDWYTGFSILQAFQGYLHEGVGYDVQGIVHWSRRRLVDDAASCATNVGACKVETRTRPVGVGILVTLNTDLIAVLKGAFGVT